MAIPPIDLRGILDGRFGGEIHHSPARLFRWHPAATANGPDPAYKSGIALETHFGINQTGICCKSPQWGFISQLPVQLGSEEYIAKLGLLVGQQAEIPALQLNVIPPQPGVVV